MAQYVRYPSNIFNQGPLVFTRNGASQVVTEDTVTPANNRPLPTELTGPNGPVTSTVNGGKTGLDVNINSAVSVTTVDAADGATGAAVPADASYSGMNVGGNLVGMTGTVNGLKVDGSAVTQPVSGTVTANQGTANATPWNENIAQVGGSAISLGQAAMAASLPVAIASNQSTLATQDRADGVTGAAVPADAIYAGMNVAGNLTGLTGTVNGLKVDGSAVTQPVSGTVTANQGTANATPWNENIAQVGGSSISLGQKTMANSMPVVIASDQSAVSVTPSLTSQQSFIRNDYSTTNVTTAAYVQLVASLGSNVKQITLFDSSGQTLNLALGAVGVEVDQIIIPPGGLNGMINFAATAGQRLSIKAISATANVGELDINFYN